ncbi:MAG: 30S ribosomal protein S20 [Micrococcaceae bacterium]
MANIKSQKKRILTNEKARLRNNSTKSEIKTLTRRVDEAIEAGDAEKAAEALKTVSRKIDKAVSKGVFHANNAANKKSKIAARVNKLEEDK